jgi:hypothetical protein
VTTWIFSLRFLTGCTVSGHMVGSCYGLKRSLPWKDAAEGRRAGKGCAGSWLGAPRQDSSPAGPPESSYVAQWRGSRGGMDLARGKASAPRESTPVGRRGWCSAGSPECRFGSRERVAQTYAFFAFVWGSSSVHGVSCLDANIMVDVPMLRTAEEGKRRRATRS